MNKKTLVYALILGVIILIAGYTFGMIFGKSNANKQYEERITEIKKLLPDTTDIRSISGVVKSITGNIVTIEAATIDPLEETPRLREIIINNETKITKSEPASPEEIQKLLETSNGRGLSIQDKQTTADIFDIEVGDNISVSANKNIKREVRFEAMTIYILPADIQLVPTEPVLDSVVPVPGVLVPVQ